jgi:hypothetical protein
VDDFGVGHPRRSGDGWTVAVQALVIVAVLAVSGVLLWAHQSGPANADAAAHASRVTVLAGRDLGGVSAEEMLGSWTASTAHGVYHYTFEPDGTWTVTRGEQDAPIAGGEFTVDEQSRLRFTSDAGYMCAGTASYDMTRPDHRTLTGEVIRDNCKFCFYRGTRLVLQRA